MSGTCQICGCTDVMPCAVEVNRVNPDGVCSWMDEAHTLCSNPMCVAEVPMQTLLDIVFPRYAHQVSP